MKQIEKRKTPRASWIDYNEGLYFITICTGLEFAWQPRYHDHKIRGVQDGNNISDYIENNVYNWESDCFYG